MKVAVVNWKIRPVRTIEDFVGHAVEILNGCLAKGATLAVLPECFTLELLHLAPSFASADVPGLIPFEALDPILDYATAHGLALIAGSTFKPSHNGYSNVSTAIWPDGRRAEQPKIVMTQFEKNEWLVSGGAGLVELPDPRFGTLVCYDSEFPEAGRAHAESGVLCLCVPAFTETGHGFWRVRHSCQARAVENQVFVLHASLVGSLGREPVPTTWGSSAILAPCTAPFPANGVLAESTLNEEGIAVAELDFESLLASRSMGDVRNWEDRHAGNWSKE